jgi:hypothetical protein
MIRIVGICASGVVSAILAAPATWIYLSRADEASGAWTKARGGMVRAELALAR